MCTKKCYRCLHWCLADGCLFQEEPGEHCGFIPKAKQMVNIGSPFCSGLHGITRKGALDMFRFFTEGEPLPCSSLKEEGIHDVVRITRENGLASVPGPIKTLTKRFPSAIILELEDEFFEGSEGDDEDNQNE